MQEYYIAQDGSSKSICGVLRKQMNDNFWLYKWIDEFEIDSHTDPITILKANKAARQRLQELAGGVSFELPPPYVDTDNALVAGRDMDLSGDLDCCLDVSKVWQINRNFGPLLHYFDKIVLAGPSPDAFARLLENPSDRVLSGIGTHIEGLLYLRDIGADEIVTFQAKIPVDRRNYKKLAEQWGISNSLDIEDEIVQLFAREGKAFNLRQANKHWHFTFRHPIFEHDVRATAWTKKKPTKRQMMRAVFADYATLLTSDVISARMMGLSLGSNADLHASMLAPRNPVSALDEAALDLYLPVLDGLPLRDIIRLRQDEHDSFVKFQAAIRAGLKAQLQANGQDPEAAAQEVQKTIIGPALSDIYQRLDGTEKSLAKKVGLGIGVGSVLTMVGVIDAVPLVIGSGFAVAATAVAAVQNYFDVRKDIANKDMYFLWQLEKEHRKHNHQS